MRYRSLNLVAASMLVFAWWAAAATAQTAAPSAQAGGAVPGGIVVASPTYTSILMEVSVNKPAADVWKRVVRSLQKCGADANKDARAPFANPSELVARVPASRQ